VHAPPLPEDCAHGSFVAPTLIEIGSMAELTREVFGPVLHVLRFPREGLDALMRDITATGYGLTFGVQSRIDATIARVTARAPAGNLYVNRNMIGAVVGVQPFGGHGLSGTGPKAGGPLYLRRLLAVCRAEPPLPPAPPPAEAEAWITWLRERHPDVIAGATAQVAASRGGLWITLPGPVGEANIYALTPRGTVLCRAATRQGLLLQLSACIATGNLARVEAPGVSRGTLDALPPALAERIGGAVQGPHGCDAVLFEGAPEGLRRLLEALAAEDGAIRPVLALSPADLAAGRLYPPDMLLVERSTSINTAAAGGNAALMSL
jgi:RHH-type proline utilization regulon transcriptional repressor/proline dehydrogenase/delta 1-pyrroline-5-carboxylate dehydrogenase